MLANIVIDFHTFLRKQIPSYDSSLNFGQHFVVNIFKRTEKWKDFIANIYVPSTECKKDLFVKGLQIAYEDRRTLVLLSHHFTFWEIEW